MIHDAAYVHSVKVKNGKKIVEVSTLTYNEMSTTICVTGSDETACLTET